jgi:uncharacterized membrane-anchored protein
MNPIQLTSREAILYVVLINAVIGIVLGLIPLLLGYFNKRLGLGIAGFSAAVAGGAVLGVFLSVPLTVVFTWLVVRKKREDGSQHPYSRDNDES